MMKTTASGAASGETKQTKHVKRKLSFFDFLMLVNLHCTCKYVVKSFSACGSQSRHIPIQDVVRLCLVSINIRHFLYVNFLHFNPLI